VARRVGISDVAQISMARALFGENSDSRAFAGNDSGNWFEKRDLELRYRPSR